VVHHGGAGEARMKILIASGIYPPDAGGPATYTRAIGRAFLKLGHEVNVVCYADGDWDHRQGNDEGDGALEVHRINRWDPLVIRYWKYFLKVLECAKKSDVVYLQGPVSEGLPGMFAAIFARKPRLMKVVGDYAWEIYMQEGDKPIESKELLDKFIEHSHEGKIGRIEMIEGWVAKRAARIIVPSVYLKNIVGRWGVPKEKMSVIYNSVSPFPPTLSRKELRSFFEVEDKHVIFTAVRAVPWKNIDFIIRLIPKLLDKKVVFVIAGEGPLYDEWKKLAKDLLVEDSVRFVGKLNRREMGEWYSAADVFVLPSGYEGFPHVIPEALAFGLRCFVSDKGGNPETRQLFPEYVTVLPYLDEFSWVNALSNTQIRKEVPILPKRLYFDSMVERTIKVIEQVVKESK
jgi:glycosyltransferase involved in cell wall biosynthesis